MLKQKLEHENNKQEYTIERHFLKDDKNIKQIIKEMVLLRYKSSVGNSDIKK